ncbi:MAG: isopentenyl-diphosphate Delta-isomerase [Candidatus Liptonbacteria bacterium]|nr:isopentenyl-diphosphate Delta-isomerase [Candidatus Liptonbacteria bacterium]
METVILVDGQDREIGAMEKIQAHRENRLHRCFSILVFNLRGGLLAQKRAAGKYHCPGLWSNTVCGHPRPGEDTVAGGRRRLREEMGFDCELTDRFQFIYNAHFSNGLSEHEYDHVLVGEYEGEVRPNPEEVEEYKWQTLADLQKDVGQNPDIYSPWFKIILADHADKFEKHRTARPA